MTPQRPRNADQNLRDLLVHLRDTFRDAASRIDGYLATSADGRGPRFDDAVEAPQASEDQGARARLDQLREEVRWISQEAPTMDKPLLRLHIEAITAETRSLQSHLHEMVDHDVASRIMRTLTAIVSDHRPGHVYGLARHHQANWSDVAQRARADIEALRRGEGPAPRDEMLDGSRADAE